MEHIEEASILGLIRGFIAAPGDPAAADLPDPEASGQLLWDLSADTTAGPALLDLGLLPALAAQLAAFLAGQLPAAPSPARTAEVCCGILANLYSNPGLVPQLLAHKGLTEAAAALMVELTDPAALSELCRLLTAALFSREVGCCRLQQQIA
jgi:hypothetical protein